MSDITIRQFIHLLFLAELILSGFWYAGSAVTAMFLLVAAMVVCRRVYIEREVRFYSQTWLMLAYLLWLFVVRFSSDVPAVAQANLAILAGLPVMYLFATNNSVFAEIWKFLQGLLCLAGVVLAIWAIGQVFLHVDHGHALGPFQDRNVFAALMNLLWFPAVFLFLTTKTINGGQYSLKLLAAGAGLLTICTALFATASRGGIGTWLLLMPVLVWAAYRNHPYRKRMLLVIMIATLAYLSSTLLLQITVADRSFEFSQDGSITARLLLWQAAIKMALAHPFAGSGWGTFASYYPAYRVPAEKWSAGFFAHNDYLQLAAEGGVLALLLQLGVLSGLLAQLWRNLKYITEPAALESATLLLAALALFIHANVNFIFYHAFINILLGLYLGRAAQLGAKANIVTVSCLRQASPLSSFMLSALLVVLIAFPYGINLLSQIINKQVYVKTENLTSTDFTVYKLAELITLVQPHERIAQETILQTEEQALADPTFMHKVGKDCYRQLLVNTLRRFDSVRALTANDASLGVRVARLLIRHHDFFPGDTAYVRAHQVLSEGLRANPYHVDSIIMLSRLQSSLGHTAEALQMIRNARAYILLSRDKQLIYIELLRQLAAPGVITELDPIEKELRKLRLGSETGRALVLPAGYYENIDARLEAIALQIQN